MECGVSILSEALELISSIGQTRVLTIIVEQLLISEMSEIQPIGP